MGNARYRRALELAASEATTNELKRQAKSALDDVPVRATWSRSPI
jgi:hypothetical protein